MTPSRPEAYSRRVERGAHLLDLRAPGWWRHVDTNRLDTSSVRDCVLGHLVRRRVIRPVYPGTHWEHTLLAVDVAGPSQTVSYGFDAPATANYARNCEIIDASWRREIDARRMGAAPVDLSRDRPCG